MRNEELIETKGIAALFNISRPRVSQLKQTAGFPRPIHFGSNTFYRHDIVEWGKETGRLSREGDAPLMHEMNAGQNLYEGVTERFGHMVHTWFDGSVRRSLAYMLNGQLHDKRVLGESHSIVFVGPGRDVDNSPELTALDRGAPTPYWISWEQAATALGQRVPYWEKMSDRDLTKYVHLTYAPGTGVTSDVVDPGVKMNSALWQMAADTDPATATFGKWMLAKAASSVAGSRYSADSADSPFAELVVRRVVEGVAGEDDITAEESDAALRLFRTLSGPAAVAVASELIERPWNFTACPFGLGTIRNPSSATIHLRSKTTSAPTSALTLALSKHMKANSPIEFREDTLSGSIYAFAEDRVEALTPSGPFRDESVTELHFYSDATAIAVRADGSCFFAGDWAIGHKSGARASAGAAVAAADGLFYPGAAVIKPDLNDKATALVDRMLAHNSDEVFIVKLDELR